MVMSWQDTIRKIDLSLVVIRTLGYYNIGLNGQLIGQAWLDCPYIKLNDVAWTWLTWLW